MSEEDGGMESPSNDQPTTSTPVTEVTGVSDVHIVGSTSVDLPAPSSDGHTEAETAEMLKEIEEVTRELADKMMANPKLALTILVQGGSAGGLETRERVENEIRSILNIGGYLNVKHGLVAKPMFLDLTTWPTDPKKRIADIKLTVHDL